MSLLSFLQKLICPPCQQCQALPEVMAKPVVPRSPHWPALERAHLAKEPFCQACGGKDCLQVHHVMPVSWDASKELDPANLITLCELAGRNCHIFFGHSLDWKSRNPNVRTDASNLLTKIQHRPYPPGH